MKTTDYRNLRPLKGLNLTLPPSTIRAVLYARRRQDHKSFFDYNGVAIYTFRKNKRSYIQYHSKLDPFSSIEACTRELKALGLFTIIKTLDTASGKPYEYIARGDVPKGLTIEMLELLGTNIYEGQVSAPQPQKGYHNTYKALDRELGINTRPLPTSEGTGGETKTVNIHERSKRLFKRGGI